MVDWAMNLTLAFDVGVLTCQISTAYVRLFYLDGIVAITWLLTAVIFVATH